MIEQDTTIEVMSSSGCYFSYQGSTFMLIGCIKCSSSILCRCQDANLMDMPVEIESPDRHYYHVAFFTNRRVKSKEELTWDYGIDFEDEAHPIPAFNCLCGSDYCRGNKML